MNIKEIEQDIEIAKTDLRGAERKLREARDGVNEVLTRIARLESLLGEAKRSEARRG